MWRPFAARHSRLAAGLPGLRRATFIRLRRSTFRRSQLGRPALRHSTLRLPYLSGLLQRLRRLPGRFGSGSWVSLLQVLCRLLHCPLTFGRGLGHLLGLLSFRVQTKHIRTQQFGNLVQSLGQLAGLLLQLLLPSRLSRLPLLRRIRNPFKPLGQLLLMFSQLLGPCGQLRRILLQTLRGLLRIRRRLLSLLRRLIKLPGLGTLSGNVGVRSRLGRRLSRW